jgi:hypothetical protein
MMFDPESGVIDVQWTWTFTLLLTADGAVVPDGAQVVARDASKLTSRQVGPSPPDGQAAVLS